MKYDEEGREVLCTLALPLPVDLLGTVLAAMADAAEKAGWGEAVLLTDGSNRVVVGPRSLIDEEASSDGA